METTIKWRQIPGWTHYEISNTGLVRGRKVLNQHINRSGYKYIIIQRRLWGTVQHWTVYVHRLMGIVWLPPKPDGYQIHHRDGDKHNNNIQNLCWVTPSYNARESFARGHKTGIFRRLYRHQYALIYALARIGISGVRIARHVGVSMSQVSRVLRGHVQSACS